MGNNSPKDKVNLKLIKKETDAQVVSEVPEKLLEVAVKEEVQGRSPTVDMSHYFFLPPLSLRAKWMTAPLAML